MPRRTGDREISLLSTIRYHFAIMSQQYEILKIAPFRINHAFPHPDSHFYKSRTYFKPHQPGAPETNGSWGPRSSVRRPSQPLSGVSGRRNSGEEKLEGIARRPLSERWCFNFNLCCLTLLSSRGKHAPKRGERISKSPSDSKEAGRCREEGERGETTVLKMGLKSERGKRDRGQWRRSFVSL